MADQTTVHILELLQTERTALRGGELDKLDAIADTKAKLLSTLPNSTVKPDDLHRISRRLTENQTLLAAAIAGVKAARDRVATLHKVQQELSVYDQSGQMAKVATPQPGLERKA